MALGFNYTLSVNESASLKNLEDFTKKIGDRTVKIGIDFDMDSFNTMIDKIQDKLDGITDKLTLEFGDFDVDIDSLQKQLKKVGDKVKLSIPAEIEVKERDLEQPLKDTGESVGNSVERQIKVIQDSLILSLNNLAQKVSKNGLDDIIPVDDIMRSIDELGKMDLKIQDVNKQAKLIRQEIQSWSQVTTAQTELFKTTATAASDVADSVLKINKANADDSLKRQTKILQQNLDIQMDNIRASKQFSDLTESQIQDFNRLADAMKLTGDSLQQVKANYQELNYQIKDFKNQNISNMVSKQDSAFKNLATTIFGINSAYDLLQAGVQGIKQVFSDATGFIKELDEAYTNINQTMSISQDEFEAWVDDATEVANQTGVLTSDVLTMMKTYAGAGETIENVQGKLAATTAFQNVTGMQAQDVTNSIQSIMNQFQMLQGTAEESAASMEYLGDVMVGVGYSLSKDEQLAMGDIITGVETAGAVVKSAGGSFEWMTAIIGTLSEQMNATGDETGNAMKMIAARTLQSKEAISELVEAGEDMSQIGVDASNAEKALTDIGVSVRDSSGEFRELEAILGDVADKWKTLNNTEQQLVSEKLAGNNRRNYFISMMENYDRVTELMNNANNAQGAFFEASEKQAESLAGKTNELKNAWTELYQQILSADMLKGGTEFLTDVVNGITALIKNIDKLIPVVAAVTASWIAFDIAMNGFGGSTVGKVIGGIGKMITKIQTMATTLGTAKIAAIGLAGVLTGVLAAGLTCAINKYQEKQEHLENIATAMDEYNQVAKETADIDEKIDTYESLNKQLEDMTLNSQQRKDIVAEIKTIRDQLSTDERYKEILDAESASLDEQLEKMRQLNEFDQRNTAFDLLESTDMSDRDIKKDTSVLEGYSKEGGTKDWYENIMKVQNDTLTELIEKQKTLTKDSKEYEAVEREISTLKSNIARFEKQAHNEQEEFIASYERLLAYQEAGLVAEEAGLTNEREQLAILEQLAPLYEELSGKQADTTEAAEDQLDTEKQITEEKQKQSEYSLGDDSGDSALAQEVKAQEELNQRYMDSLTYLQEANDLINMMADGLSIDDMNTILDSELMNDFTGAIDNATQVTEHLKGKMQEMQDIAYETYGNMMLADDEYWTEAMRSCAQALGVNTIEFIDYINEKGLARKVDVTNAKNATDAENQMNMSLHRQLITGYVGVVNSKAGNRKTDMSNVAAFLNTQEAKEADTVEDLKRMWAEYYNAKKKTIQSELGDLSSKMDALAGDYGDLGNIDPSLMAGWNDLRNQLRDLEASNDAMTNYFNNVNTYLDGVSSSLAQAAATAGSAIGSAGAGSGSGSGSGGSSGSSATKREVEDMESLVDRYYALNDAIRKVTKALEVNREKQETVKTKSEYKKLVEEEIKLINQEITALQNLQKEQQKERNEIQKTLKSNGFNFNADGDITNYASQLKKLTDQANKITNPDKKEAAQAQVRAIADLIDAYTELEDTTIPGTAMEIENLKNEIESINKEFEENMELIEQLGDRYFDVMSKLADVENKLAMNDKLQANSVGKEKLQLMRDELKLIAQKQKLLKEQQAQSEAEAKKLQKQLKAEGVSFDSNGNIANYEALTKQLTDKANNLVGDAQDEAVEHAEKILDLIDQYMTLTDDTIPGLEESWQDYANQVEDIQREMTDLVVDMQKQVTQAYEEEQNKRFNKLQENLKKEQDALNKAYEEETYTKGLQSQQRQLDELSQQIAIYSRDTSEVGKARLEQLKQEYAALQEEINEGIREHENELANERFDQESAALDEELAAILAPENLVSTVNQAITSGMITVGDEVMRLDELMTNWMDESGDGLYALGGQLKSELVDNLQAAKDIMDSMGLSGMASLSKAFPSGGTTNNQNTINFNESLVKVEGNMSNDVDAEALAQQLKNEVYKAINDAMS